MKLFSKLIVICFDWVDYWDNAICEADFDDKDDPLYGLDEDEMDVILKKDFNDSVKHTIPSYLHEHLRTSDNGSIELWSDNLTLEDLIEVLSMVCNSFWESIGAEGSIYCQDGLFVHLYIFGDNGYQCLNLKDMVIDID